MAAFRTLWTAFVGLYEDSLPLVGGNLAALAVNLPLGLVVLGIALGFVGAPVLPGGADAESASGLPWLIALIAVLLLVLPTPGNLALAHLTSVAAGPDLPRFRLFVDGLKQEWLAGLKMFGISLAILLALIWNIAFYLSVPSDWMRYISVIWVYVTAFWIGVQVYVVPFVAYRPETRLVDLYRRAALIALGHLGFTLVVVFGLLCIAVVAVAFAPIYVLVGGALVSLVQAHALREIRRRHGDLVPEPDEGRGQL